MNNFFTTRDGINLNYEISSTDKPIWIIHSHGVGEHLGRHKYLAEEFGPKNNVFQYDLRGHGKSGGKRAWVDDFYDYIRDLSEIIEYLKDKYQMKKYILMGHSMGALVTSGYIQIFANKNFYPTKIILTSPPVGVGGPLKDLALKIPMQIINFISDCKYSIPIPGLVELVQLSHNPQVAIDYKADKLNSLALHLKLAINILKASREIFAKPINPLCPAYIVIGTSDKVVNYDLTKSYFSTIETKFTYKEFDGAFHEIHNEISSYKDSFFKYLHSIIAK